MTVYERQQLCRIEEQLQRDDPRFVAAFHRLAAARWAEPARPGWRHSRRFTRLIVSLLQLTAGRGRTALGRLALLGARAGRRLTSAGRTVIRACRRASSTPGRPGRGGRSYRPTA